MVAHSVNVAMFALVIASPDHRRGAGLIGRASADSYPCIFRWRRSLQRRSLEIGPATADPTLRSIA